MKKTFFLLILCSSLCTVSCVNDDLDNVSKPNSEILSYQEKGKMLSLGNKMELRKLLNQDGVNLQSLKTRAFEEQFISMMDVVKDNDPLLDKYSIEEKDYIKENSLSYYELLDFEELVPNENFACLLNSKGDVQVNDTVYRITPYGTLFTKSKYMDELEAISGNLDNTLLEFRNNNELKLSNNVTLVNTFDHMAIEDIPVSSINIVEKTDNLENNIPFQSFPRYSNESHTFAGKMLGKLFGDRSVKHHDFMKGYRVKGSLYDYDYGVYCEIGTYVAMRKKRGGFFKAINGWKGTRADQLSIIYKGIVLEMNTKVPENLQMPSKPMVINNNVRLDVPGIGKQLWCLDICGLSITSNDVLKLSRLGIKAALPELKKWLGGDVDTNIQAVRILSPSNVYIVILDNQINEYNVEMLRKVFNSGVKFYVSSNMINNPLSFKSAWDFINGLRDLPIKRLKGGEVVLAGKLNGNWGGMVIYKN